MFLFSNFIISLSILNFYNCCNLYFRIKTIVFQNIRRLYNSSSRKWFPQKLDFCLVFAGRATWHAGHAEALILNSFSYNAISVSVSNIPGSLPNTPLKVRPVRAHFNRLQNRACGTQEESRHQFSVWQEADVRKYFLTGSTKYSGPQPEPTSTVARASQSNSSQKRAQQVLLRTVLAVWSDPAAEGIVQGGLENLQWCRWHRFSRLLLHCWAVHVGKKVSPYSHSLPSLVSIYAHCLSPSFEQPLCTPLWTARLCFLDSLLRVTGGAVVRSCTPEMNPPTDQISPAHWTTSQEVLQTWATLMVLCWAFSLSATFFLGGGVEKTKTGLST